MEGHHHMNMDHLEHHNNKISPNEAHLSHSNHHMNDTLLIEEFNNILNGTDNLDSSLKGYDDNGHGDHILSHGAHSSHEMHMSMTFHGGYMETILFSWWKVTDMGEFMGSFLAIFIMALFYEGLKYYRKHLLWKTYTGLQYCAVAPPDKGVANICAADEPQVIQSMPHVLERNIPTMMSAAHAWQTVLHGIQVLVSYMLMLVFMTYNTWLCAAVVLGSATGYFLFGWRESVVVDFTEHCH